MIFYPHFAVLGALLVILAIVLVRDAWEHACSAYRLMHWLDGEPERMATRIEMERRIAQAKYQAIYEAYLLRATMGRETIKAEVMRDRLALPPGEL